MADSLKDELIAKQGGTTANSSASSVAESGSVSMPVYADQDRVDAINKMYDANINARKNALQTSYDKNVSDLEANRESIAKRYQQQRNIAATDYERQRRNFNEQAMMNGLGTGVGTQAALAQNAMYQKQQGTINAAEGSDISALERNIADLKVKYQNDINTAIADNDYKRAAAMLDEYNLAYNRYKQEEEQAYNRAKQEEEQAYNRAKQEAQIKAQYGDFSGYASMYGEDIANQMKDVWMRQNPGIAYSLGYIGADAYYQLTGRYPAGYSVGGSGSGGGSRSSRYSNGGGSTTIGNPNLSPVSDESKSETPPSTKNLEEESKESWTPSTDEFGRTLNPGGSLKPENQDRFGLKAIFDAIAAPFNNLGLGASVKEKPNLVGDTSRNVNPSYSAATQSTVPIRNTDRTKAYNVR